MFYAFADALPLNKISDRIYDDENFEYSYPLNVTVNSVTVLPEKTIKITFRPSKDLPAQSDQGGSCALRG